MKKIILLLLIAFGIIAHLYSAEITGRVVGITDGDTVTVIEQDQGKINRFTVRLYGIDAPEKQQEFGTKAREYLSKLIFDKYVRVHFREIDRYGRIVGRIYDGEKEINVQMIAAGMAWHYRQYSADKEYSDAETKARELKAGLWSSPVPVPPWQWRKIKKNPFISR